jgi:glycosyltransferase involved in cell wall biosynthesis
MSQTPYSVSAIAINKIPIQQAPLGVSIAICTHNGQDLLPSTLQYLKGQRVARNVDWEVLVIDNLSDDASTRIACEYWGDDGPAPMRIVHEPRLGLSYARERAFAEARYETVSFVDDDNRVAPDWVATVSECMSLEPDLGALGSTNIATAEVDFPEWFWRWAHYYAAHGSCQFETLEHWILVGAGMTIRKRCWDDLKRNGFQSRLTDRVGSRLTTCGDLELGCAIQLAGWKIRVEPRLKLEHYMTPRRLQWNYLRRLARATGQAMALLDGYFFFSQPETGLKGRLRRHWWAHLIRETLNILRHYPTVKVIRAFSQDLEGDDDVINLELRVGRLIGLLQLRSRYGSLRREIARAPWRRTRLIK